MPAHRMKTGRVNFRRHTPQICYHSNASWASRSNFDTVCSIFAESLVDIILGTPMKTMQTCVFLVFFPTCTHALPANSPSDLRGCWRDQVHEIFDRHKRNHRQYRCNNQRGDAPKSGGIPAEWTKTECTNCPQNAPPVGYHGNVLIEPSQFE